VNGKSVFIVMKFMLKVYRKDHIRFTPMYKKENIFVFHRALSIGIQRHLIINNASKSMQ
jgi:hypothetical protein